MPYNDANKAMFLDYTKKYTPDGEIRFLTANPDSKTKGVGTFLLNELAKREYGKEIYLFVSGGVYGALSDGFIDLVNAQIHNILESILLHAAVTTQGSGGQDVLPLGNILIDGGAERRGIMLVCQFDAFVCEVFGFDALCLVDTFFLRRFRDGDRLPAETEVDIPVTGGHLCRFGYCHIFHLKVLTI